MHDPLLLPHPPGNQKIPEPLWTSHATISTAVDLITSYIFIGVGGLPRYSLIQALSPAPGNRLYLAHLPSHPAPVLRHCVTARPTSPSTRAQDPILTPLMCGVHVG